MKKHLVFLTLLLGAPALMPPLAQQQDASGPNSLQRDTPRFHRTVAARFLQGSPTSSPAAVRNTLVSQATLNRLTGLPTGTANRLLFRSGAQ
jgi:hypothetical protein